MWGQGDFKLHVLTAEVLIFLYFPLLKGLAKKESLLIWCTDKRVSAFLWKLSLCKYSKNTTSTVPHFYNLIHVLHVDYSLAFYITCSRHLSLFPLFDRLDQNSRSVLQSADSTYSWQCSWRTSRRQKKKVYMGRNVIFVNVVARCWWEKEKACCRVRTISYHVGENWKQRLSLFELFYTSF